ncbi:MAG TPA: nuclear transport factor 2 family protein [Blastocatellia bacterium]|nr:nuclear transport factor 2 family protein [Blastocatellia bacterium]
MNNSTGKTISLTTLFRFTVSMIAMATTAFALTASTRTDDESAVRAALVENAAGFERNDIARVSKVWAQDESVTVFESGHANYGWADYRDHHLVPEMAELKNTKYALSNIKIRVAGDSAWATFKYTISADLKERHVEGEGLGTAVLEKRAGRWLIVHWHSSSPRRTPADSPPPKKG